VPSSGRRPPARWSPALRRDGPGADGGRCLPRRVRATPRVDPARQVGWVRATGSGVWSCRIPPAPRSLAMPARSGNTSATSARSTTMEMPRPRPPARAHVGSCWWVPDDVILSDPVPCKLGHGSGRTPQLGRAPTAARRRLGQERAPGAAGVVADALRPHAGGLTDHVGWGIKPIRLQPARPAGHDATRSPPSTRHVRSASEPLGNGDPDGPHTTGSTTRRGRPNTHQHGLCRHHCLVHQHGPDIWPYRGSLSGLRRLAASGAAEETATEASHAAGSVLSPPGVVRRRAWWCRAARPARWGRTPAAATDRRRCGWRPCRGRRPGTRRRSGHSR
jgi:hypothetical protein